MQWWEWAAIACFLLGFVAMGAVVALRVKNNPLLLIGIFRNIWVQLKPVILTVVIPFILKYVGRMDTDTEARMRECERRGGRWDNFRKKCVETK